MKKVKTLIATATLSLVCLISSIIAVTGAWFTHKSEVKTATITIGKPVALTIDGTFKKPTVLPGDTVDNFVSAIAVADPDNTSSMYIRAKISTEDAIGDYITVTSAGNDWVQCGDYFYYTNKVDTLTTGSTLSDLTVLEQGGQTTSLDVDIKVKSTATEETLTPGTTVTFNVVFQAIQSANTGNKTIAEVDAAWGSGNSQEPGEEPEEPEVPDEPEENFEGLYSENDTLTTSWADLVSTGNVTVSNSTLSNVNTSLSGNLKLPDQITSVSSNAFDGCNSLTGITVSDQNTAYSSVDGVLYNKTQTELVAVPGAKTSVTIGADVTVIAKNAFTNCSSLATVTFEGTEGYGWFTADDKAETNISASAIDVSVASTNATNLTSSTWGNYYLLKKEVVEETAGLFDSEGTLVSSWEELVANNDVKVSGNEIISVSNALEGNLVISSEIVKIGNYAFNGCRSLSGIEIPDSVLSIGGCAFQSCIGLTSIELPSEITFISEYTFYGCSNLVSVDIKDSVGAIYKAAFSGCRALTEIDIPTSVTQIKEYAFQNCSNLTNIYISEYVSLIGEAPFQGCTNLMSIEVSEDNPKYFSIDSVLYYKPLSYFTSLELVACPAKKTSIEIPSTVTKIQKSAFDNTSLISIEIPESITTINAYAFYNCSVLETVTFADTEGWTANNETIDVTDPSTNATNLKSGAWYNKELKNS